MKENSRMEKMDGNNELGTMNISVLLAKMAIPLVLSLLVQVLYGIVDSMYVSRLGDLALTAVSLSSPIQHLVTGIGAGIGVGMNSLLSRKLGEHDDRAVSRIAGNGLLVVWSAGLLFALAGVFLIKPFFEFQTSDAAILEMSASYGSVICILAVASLQQVFFERMLSATGKTSLTMASMLTGAVINMILDPIFIFGYCGIPALGIAGAAYATVLAQGIAALMGLVLNLAKNREVKFTRGGLLPQQEVIAEILNIGIPVALSQSMISVLAFGINNILLSLSALAPAVYVVYIRLQSFVLMPANGLSDANVSIIAYNYGAKQRERVTETLKKSMIANLVIGIFSAAAFFLLPERLLSIFNASPEMMRIGVPAIRIICVSIPLTGSTNILRGFLQAMGRGRESLLLAIAQAVLLLGGAWLWSLTGRVNLVWLAFPIMEVFRLLLAGRFVRKTYCSFDSPGCDSQSLDYKEKEQPISCVPSGSTPPHDALAVCAAIDESVLKG